MVLLKTEIHFDEIFLIQEDAGCPIDDYAIAISNKIPPMNLNDLEKLKKRKTEYSSDAMEFFYFLCRKYRGALIPRDPKWEYNCFPWLYCNMVFPHYEDTRGKSELNINDIYYCQMYWPKDFTYIKFDGYVTQMYDGEVNCFPTRNDSVITIEIYSDGDSFQDRNPLQCHTYTFFCYEYQGDPVTLPVNIQMYKNKMLSF